MATAPIALFANPSEARAAPLRPAAVREDDEEPIDSRVVVPDSTRDTHSSLTGGGMLEDCWTRR
jgi:hypothetical protein